MNSLCLEDIKFTCTYTHEYFYYLPNSKPNTEISITAYLIQEMYEARLDQTYTESEISTNSPLSP